MPEVFYDTYRFPSQAELPTIDALRQKITTLLNGTEKILDAKTYDMSIGATPTIRTFVRFVASSADITLINDAPSLIIEVNVVGPIEILYRIDTLLTSLNAKPRFGQKSWQATMRYRKIKKNRTTLLALLLLAAAIYIIYRFTWLGLAAVVLLTAALLSLYIILLAKSMRH